MAQSRRGCSNSPQPSSRRQRRRRRFFWNERTTKPNRALQPRARARHQPKLEAPSTVALHRSPVGQGTSGPGWLAIALGFWSGRALATGTAWAGLCLIHYHQPKLEVGVGAGLRPSTVTSCPRARPGLLLLSGAFLGVSPPSPGSWHTPFPALHVLAPRRGGGPPVHPLSLPPFAPKKTGLRDYCSVPLESVLGGHVSFLNRPVAICASSPSLASRWCTPPRPSSSPEARRSPSLCCGRERRTARSARLSCQPSGPRGARLP